MPTSSSQASFSPWELASLKVMFHRFDDRHKGYLDEEDLRRACAACHLFLTAEEFSRLVSVMDRDSDLRLNFDEFVTFLALSGPEHPDAVRLRAEMMSDRAALTAGAALGILPVLKGKLFVVLGTLFYDPIRLFRDSFVDYSTTIRTMLNRKRHGEMKAAVASDEGFISICRSHAKETHILKTAFWLSYTIVLDSAVGVVMFLTYGKVRRALIQCSEQMNVNKAHSEKSIGVNWSSPSFVKDVGCTMELVTGQVIHGHPARLEAVSGFVGGAAGGLLEKPCRFLARANHTSPRLRNTTFLSWLRATKLGLHFAFRGTPFAVCRNAVGHAVFFSSFAASKAAMYTNFFGPQSVLQLERTSWRDTIVTASAGCCAGAAFRTVSVPMSNVYKLSRNLSAAPSPPTSTRWFRTLVLERALLRAVFRGYAQSLAYTMPVTGVAFLVYEMTLMSTS